MESVAKLSRVAISKILLATDFSAEAQNALTCALALAKRYDSKLFITHAVPPDAEIQGVEVQVPLHDVMQSNAERNLALLEQTPEVRSLPHEMVVRSGDPWEVLSEVISDENIDLVVMGTHGRGGISKLFLGSTAEKAIRHARCPVLTVGPDAKPLSFYRLGQILYATDFSDGSLRALNYALALAEEDGSELTMLHVIESTPASKSELVEWIYDDREKLHQMVPSNVDLACKPEMEVETGAPGQEIVRLAASRNAALIVMGARPDGAIVTHVPWTTLHHVLQHAPCPVLTVRGD
jgi:nucleotide-binding universal stress UspA family protein